jgi:hypothetical protein
MTTLGPLEGLGEQDIESPPFAGEPAAYCAAAGAQGDSDMALWRQGVRQRFPPGTHYRTVATRLGARIAANDTPNGEALRLQRIGETRDIERYAGESDAGYCERLAAAFPTWTAAGTPDAIIRQLNAFGLPDVAIYEEYAYGITSASEYGWRFVVLLGPSFGSLGWTAPVLGTCTLGEDQLGVTGITSLQRDAIKRIVLKWKQVFSFPLRILFLFDAIPLGGGQLGSIILGQGSIARVSMGEVRELGKAKLGARMGRGFNT